MSDNSLPDEIISEILSPALKVADDVFSDTSRVSPFSNYSESTSAYLLVCKSWLRVATPLLYHVVVLRSKAQAKALAGALSMNNALGQFIKKLRVEGGYGLPMHTILQSAPHVSDLYLSFEIFSSDNTSGLCKGLQLINPTRLILQDKSYHPLKNKMLLKLVDAVAQALPKWDRLSVFDCPYYGGERVRSFVGPLVKAKRLHTILIPTARSARWAYQSFKGCPLRAIKIKEPVATWDLRSVDFVDDPTLKTLVRYTTRASVSRTSAQESYPGELSIAPSLNPFFIPMSATSKEVQDKVWSRVLYFAMSIPERLEDPGWKGIIRGLRLLMVSKTFHKLCLPHYYTHVVLRDTPSASKLVSVLSHHPSLAADIRTISVSLVSDGEYNFYSDDEMLADTETSEGSSADAGERSSWGSGAGTILRANDKPTADPMLAILSKTSGLLRLSTRLKGVTMDGFLYYDGYGLEEPISWDAFVAAAECSGTTLRECSVRIAAQRRASPAVFKDLTGLLTLVWKCNASFLCDRAVIPVDGLPSLQELQILQTDESFMTVLSLMKLTSLRRVNFSCDAASERFLRAHGADLHELDIPLSSVQDIGVCIFDLCPNLRSLALSWKDYSTAIFDEAPPNKNEFLPRKSATSLTNLKFLLPYHFRVKDTNTQWERFFETFSAKSLPSLSEIQLTCIDWPTTEREINKSCWVRIAEDLLKRNLILTDKLGKKWRPRLKANGRR
ncbi:hypothetical protein GGX14DRAFT_626475 [Mycena pura]|uniref:Uncharacterized protein n=1 Tax=Mycena pura TaxID=153505 RepID=A0AAD6YHE4_9AGAR|nr:hypothetical protein GGX14DRAFT_626475 [Mycena pura]